MPIYLMAHDLGTTGNKATLFDAEGAIIASAFASYPTQHPKPGWATQSANDWRDAVFSTTRELLAKAPEARNQLAAVSFSAMMNGCLLVDSQGNPLHDALIHADIRSAAQCERIAEEVGEAFAYQTTGNRLAPYFTLGKLAWMVENEPELLRRAQWCVQAKDFLAGTLTGVWGITDRSDASLTGCFDLERGVWAEPLIRAAGFSTTLLPEPLPSTTLVGRVTREAAEATGLPEGLPVVLGGGDGACATAGAGAVRAGDAYHYMGGTSWVAAVTDTYRPDPTRRVSVFCGLDTRQWVVYGTVQSAGSSLDWFREAIGVGETQEGESEFEALERLVRAAPAASQGLYFLPYLAGERSPIWDAAARGVFFGLTTAHGRAELARSVFEGVAYALQSNLAVMQELGLAPAKVRVLGGGMRSTVWREILAAVYGRPLLCMERLSEATSCGAAMVAGVGVGLYPDFATAAECFAPLAGEETPDPALCELYAQTSAVFRSLYPAFAETFARLAASL